MIRDLIIFSIIFLCLDSIYLKNIAPEFGKMIQKIQGSGIEFKIGPTIIVYIALTLVWYVFIYPELKKKTLRQNLFRAAILGICIYATYDFTNLAVIKNYKLNIAIIDSIWGGILYSFSTYIFIFISSLVS
tara:strand:+ start:471 stop:863 length:393 start_codon:yes stop_codon:yes gene_type:complete